MSKKIKFKDYPFTDSYGQYFYYDESKNSFEDSDSLPERYDKFTDKDLYTTVKDEFWNNQIVSNNIQFPAAGFIKIDEMHIVNNGVSGEINHVKFQAWMFDNYAYELIAGAGVSPMNHSYSTFWNNFSQMKNTRIY